MDRLMSHQISKKIITSISLIFFLMASLMPHGVASDTQQVTVGNFGLPGMLDLPTARRMADGDLVITHQNHKTL